MAQEALGEPAGTAPAGEADHVLTQTQNWGSRSHRELYDLVHTGNDPGRVGELAQEWTRLGREIEESAHTMTEHLRATEQGWQGMAADAARAAILQLADWSRSAGRTAGEVGGRVDEQGRIMEVAKTAMPEPVQPEPAPSSPEAHATGDLAGLANAATDAKMRHDQTKSGHEQAVAVMKKMESDSRGVDGAIPRFVPPPNPIHPEPAVAGASTSPAQPRQADERPDAEPGATTAEQPASNQSASAEQRSAAPLSADAGSPPKQEPHQVGAGGASAPALQTGRPQGSGQSAKPLADQSGDRSGQRAESGSGGSTRNGKDDSSKDDSGKDETKKDKSSEDSHKAKDGQDKAAEHGDKKVKVDKPAGTSAQGSAPPLAASSGIAGDDPQQPRSNPVRGAENSFTPQGSSAGGGGGGQRTGWGGSLSNNPDSGKIGSGGSSGSLAEGDRAETSSKPAAPSASARGGPTAQPPAGAPGASTMGSPGGGAGMGGRGAGGAQEETRSTKYVEGEQIVEVPGADLPPAVIGERKANKSAGQQGAQPDQGGRNQ